MLATAGYLGFNALSRAKARREEERLARPWLSKDAGAAIAMIDSAAAALAALTSSSSSSSSSFFSFLSSSSPASPLLVVADLSNKGLRSLRLAELAGVTAADLGGNQKLELLVSSASPLSPPPPPPPTGLPPPRFSLAALRSLGLSRCGLTSIPRGLARACPNLSDLDLSHNDFGGVLEARGQLPKSLLRLNAQGNRGVVSIDDETLAPLTNLVLLGLRSCSLESLPGPALGGLTRLRELYVTDNRLRELPAEIGLCTSLVKLQASFNLLETLPLAQLAELPRLEMLRAAACRISSLPGLDELVSRKGRKKNKKAFRSLCWLSLAGNPVFDSCVPPPREDAARVFDLDVDLNKCSRGEELGSGASGDVVAVKFDAVGGGSGDRGGGGGKKKKNEGESLPTLAFKRFRGDAGPDGRAVDEVAVARAVNHGALASTIGTVVAAAAVGKGGGEGKGGGKKGRAAAAAAAVVASSTDIPSPSCSPLSSLPAGLLLELIEGKPLAEKPRGDPGLLRCTWPVRSSPSFRRRRRRRRRSASPPPTPSSPPRASPRGWRTFTQTWGARTGTFTPTTSCATLKPEERRRSSTSELLSSIAAVAGGARSKGRKSLLRFPPLRPSNRGRSVSSSASSPSTGSRKEEEEEKKKGKPLVFRKLEKRLNEPRWPRPTHLRARGPGSPSWPKNLRAPRGRSADTMEESSSFLESSCLWWWFCFLFLKNRNYRGENWKKECKQL